MGLILAVNTYKKETGVPFANYACFCIEREIHKMHKQEGKLIENILANNMIYIDSYKAINDEDDISQHDVIPDVLAEEELDRLLEENDIQEFFNQIIIPSIQDIAGRSQVVHRKVDMEFWTNLEIQLFLELAEVDSQKARINFKRMAEALNISIPNVKGKHSRVIARIKERCKERGYDVD
jgi:uncharacterized protein YfbU (UPF0304 family)